MSLKYIKMKKYLFVHLTICTVLSAAEPLCFQYTWRRPRGESNCTEHAKDHSQVPCIDPLYESDKMPNMTELWQIKNKKLNDTKDNTTEEQINDSDEKDPFCSMGNNNVCVKYTFYIYNGAVENVSYFCGKVIEDRETAVSAGCFVQHTEGHTIEACACRSRSGNMPCNSAMRNTYSMLIIFIAISIPLFAYAICNTY